MKNKTFLSIIALAAMTITSCKTELEPQPSTEVSATDTVSAPAAAVAENAQTTTQVVPTQAMPAPTTMSTQAAPTQVAPTAKGMNPAHGQPNHRCDIAVGAPLNSPKKASPAVTPTPTAKSTVTQVSPSNATTPTLVSSPSVNAAPATTAPGMNPPHGQPGHECSVAVGAPLPKKE